MRCRLLRSFLTASFSRFSKNADAVGEHIDGVAGAAIGVIARLAKPAR